MLESFASGCMKGEKGGAKGHLGGCQGPAPEVVFISCYRPHFMAHLVTWPQPNCKGGWEMQSLTSFYVTVFRYFLKFILFIYLAAPGLSCGTRDLQLWHENSQLRHAYGIQFPDKGSNLCPLQWKCRVLTTGQPGNYGELCVF